MVLVLVLPKINSLLLQLVMVITTTKCRIGIVHCYHNIALQEQ